LAWRFFKKTQFANEKCLGNPSTQKRRKKIGKHPTQKPIDLLVRIILASTNKGDLVVDPFTGSSTTGLAAFLNNRKFIGMDIEKKYLDLSIKRFKDLKRWINKNLYQKMKQ